MASEDLVLDRKVRDWVVVPLTLCILLMMLLRQYVSKVCNLHFCHVCSRVSVVAADVGQPLC